MPVVEELFVHKALDEIGLEFDGYYFALVIIV